MAASWLLTLLAICGIFAGVFLVRSGRSSDYLAAAGGGLLLGISLFWLVPEVGEAIGLLKALLSAAAVAFVMVLADHALTHGGHSAHQKIIWPILVATALHSLLDGWSVRLLNTGALMNAAVIVGLALHKFPEGVGLGWVLRRSHQSSRRALIAGTAAESFTLLGAAAEPQLNASAFQHFGAWWPDAIISLIAGGFIFLGLHAVLPTFKERKAIALFVATLVLVAALTLVRQ